MRAVVAATLAAVAMMLGAVPVVTPCPTEDSTLCYWDSSTHGNGLGLSYVALTEDVRLYY